MPSNPRLAVKESDFTFFDDVYDVVRLIPLGRVTSYGAIAAYLGSKGSARMVGWAMNAAHIDKSIPAHRVVNRHGLLTGRFHFESSDAMEQLLGRENIRVVDFCVVDFERVFWDPAKELA